METPTKIVKKRIAHLGTFDVENYGDLLFPHILERRLRSRNFEFVHVSPSGHRGVWADGAPSISFDDLRREISAFDGLIIGGGNIVHGSPTRLSYYDHGGLSPLVAYLNLWLGATLLADRAGLPICWNGPGVPSVPTGDRAGLVSWALSRADYLSVRDTGSRELLRSANPDSSIHIVPDTALEVSDLWDPRELEYAYETACTERGRTRPDRSIVFHVNRRYVNEDLELLARRIDAICFAGQATPILIALGPCHGDGELQRDLANYMGSDPLVIDQPSSLREIAACISLSKGYLGSSLHGLITTCSFGLPAALIGSLGMHKFEGFLRQFGLEQWMLKSWREAEERSGDLFSTPRETWQKVRQVAMAPLDRHWKDLEERLACPASRDSYATTDWQLALDGDPLFQPMVELAARETYEVLARALSKVDKLQNDTVQLAEEVRGLRKEIEHLSQLRIQEQHQYKDQLQRYSHLLEELLEGASPPVDQDSTQIHQNLSVRKGKPEEETEKARFAARRSAPRAILLVNDTSATNNPGCKAAVASIQDAYGMTASGVSWNSLPLGYWAEAFRAMARRSRDVVVKEAGRYPVWKAGDYPPLDLARWDETREELWKADSELRRSFDGAELVVVNGEGSIHHDLPRALALLALCATCAEAGLPVHLVNCSIQSMDTALLRRVLPTMEAIHVREQLSARVVTDTGRTPLVTVDLAFLADMEERAAPELPAMINPACACLLSSGVLVNPQALSNQIDVLRKAGLDPVYFAIGDGGEIDCASKVCGEAHIPMVRADSVPWRSLLEYLSRYVVAVSGRHHLNIFLARAGVPFIPLPSNTWKIEATLEMIDYPIFPCGDGERLAATVQEVLDDLRVHRVRSRIAGKKGVENAKSFTRGGLPWS